MRLLTFAFGSLIENASILAIPPRPRIYEWVGGISPHIPASEFIVSRNNKIVNTKLKKSLSQGKAFLCYSSVIVPSITIAAKGASLYVPLKYQIA